jgi:hypothetical protein
MYILECAMNLIEERRKSYKERRTIRAAPAKPKGRSRKAKSLYSPVKFKPFKKSNRRRKIIRESRRRVF